MGGDNDFCHLIGRRFGCALTGDGTDTVRCTGTGVNTANHVLKTGLNPEAINMTIYGGGVTVMLAICAASQAISCVICGAHGVVRVCRAAPFLFRQRRFRVL